MNILDLLKAPWAIEPEMLTEMCAIYTDHRNGEARDIKAIEAAIGKPLNNEPKPYQVQDGVALIPVEGVLAKRMGMLQQISGGQSYTALQQELAQALADPGVSSIILTIDSPGGTVDGVQAACDAIYAARSQKPIVAYVDGKATSAAYWLGSAASQMYIGSDTDQVGSIGVITTHVDTSAADTLRGLKYTDLTAGRYKATGSSHKPLSGQDFGALQATLDQLYGTFVDTVARNRGTDAKTVIEKMADGRVFMGQNAIDAGLVDGKMTLPKLMQKMKSTSRVLVPGRATRAEATSQPITATPASTFAAPASEPHPASTLSSVPQKPLSESEKKVQELRDLMAEETSLRRLLKEAVKAQGTAQSNITSARHNRASVDALEPLVRVSIRSDDVIRELRTRLRENNSLQLRTLSA